MNKRKIVYGIIVIVVAIGLFYGGVKYGQAHVSSTASGAGRFAAGATGGFAGRTGTRAGGAGGGAPVIGTILSSDSQSITISLQGGGSRIVFTSGQTAITKTTQGSTTDLQTGTAVVVTGTSNSDGSMTAQSIQIRPAMPQQANQ